MKNVRFMTSIHDLTMGGVATSFVCMDTRGHPDSKVRVTNVGLTWVLAAPGGPYVGPMNLAIRVMASSVHAHSVVHDTTWFGHALFDWCVFDWCVYVVNFINCIC